MPLPLIPLAYAGGAALLGGATYGAYKGTNEATQNAIKWVAIGGAVYFVYKRLR